MKLYNYLLKTILFFLFSSTIVFGQQTKGDTCATSAQADLNAQIVEAVAQTVGKAAEIYSEFLEEQPEAEVALEAVQLSMEVVNSVAESFQEHQYGAPIPQTISWNKLTETAKNWTPVKSNPNDPEYPTYLEDTFQLSRKIAENGPGKGRLIFSQKGTSYWWKGMVVFNKNDTNSWKELVCLWDRNSDGGRDEMQVDFDKNLSDTHHIVLSKAKTLGVHTNMYSINNWKDADTDYDYFITWRKD